MGTAEGMLREARRWLGTSGRPNALTRAYAERHMNPYFRTAPWCNIAVTEWARRSGNADAVLPAGDRAYTVWAAQDFQRINRWYVGTTANVDKARPGDIVFFDWGNSNSIGAIDHVGVVEEVLGGGRLQTIEGNTGDACKRRVRAAAEIAGYGRPAYTAYKWNGKAPSPTLKRGDIGDRVRDLQNALMKIGEKLPKFGDDGDYGVETENAVKAFQLATAVAQRGRASGIYDADTAEMLGRALGGNDQEEDDMRYYGQVANGAGAVTAIALKPGDVTAIGFWGNNVLQQLPPAKLLVVVHDAKGEYTRDVVVDAAKPKPWFNFRDPKTTDGVAVRRADDGLVAIGWDAS